MRVAITITITLAILQLFANASTAADAETLDNQTPLNVLERAATNENAEAECLLADRLISGHARSEAIQRLLVDSAKDIIDDWNYGIRLNYVTSLSGTSVIDYNFDVRGTTNSQAWKADFINRRTNFLKLKNDVEQKELNEALNLLQASVAKGNVEAMLDLAVLYSDGTRVPQNLERSFELNKQAAALGEPSGMGNLGLKYARGAGVAKDMNEAMKWLEKAFEKGSIRAGVNMANILLDGGLDGKDDGYPKNPQRAYALGRGIQLASQEGSRAYQWGAEIVSKARQNLDPDQLIAAEQDAETISKQLSSTRTQSAPQPAINLKNHATMSKNEWKAKFGQAYPGFSVARVVQMKKQDFLNLCGEPDKTQTIEDKVYWYYTCQDGDIQFVLDKGILMAGIVVGHVNDF